MNTAKDLVDKAVGARVRRFRAICILLGATVLAVGMGEIFIDWQASEDEAVESQAMYARVAEGQLATTLDVVESNLRRTRDAVEPWPADADPVVSHRLLVDAVRGQPVLRSMSVLDGNGRVLASSNTQNVDAVVALSALGGISASAEGRVGPPFAARDLRQLADGGVQPAGDAGLPLVMTTWGQARAPMLLVAVLDPGRLASEQRLLLGDAALRAAVISADGQLVSAGSGVPLNVASRSAGLTALSRAGTGAGQGTYIDKGFDGEPAVGAYRRLRAWPLLVVVERPYAEVWEALGVQLWWAVAGAVASLACIAMGYLLVHRGHANELAAHRKVAGLLAQAAANEQRWQFALEGAGDGLWDWNLVTNDFHHSVRALSMLGYAEGEVGGRQEDWAALIHPQDVVRVRAARMAHLEGKTPLVHEEMRVRCKDGSWKQILTRGMVTQRDAEGRPARMTGTLTDVTEQRAAEAALAMSQARREAVLQSSLDAIITIDDDALIVDFNAAAEAMFERRRADVLQQPLHDLLLPPEQRGPFLRAVRRFKRTADSPLLNRRLEAAAVRADGSVFPIEFSMVAVKVGDRQWFTATMHDISERKRVERALRDSEARALNIFEQAAVGVIQQAADRRFLRVNQTLCRMLQYTNDEFMRMTPDDLIHPDDVTAGVEGVSRFARGEISSFVQEKRIRRKDGSYIWVRLTASIGHDAPGQPFYVIGIVEDIQAQKMVQHELDAARRREAQFAVRVQQELLVTPARSALPCVWLSNYTRPSDGVDGDFFELLQPGPHCVDLIVGDVMGKGVNAALMGAAVKMQLARSLIELMTTDAGGLGVAPEPARILTAVHDAMTPHLQALDAFVTLCYVRIDRRAGTLTWAGCGHEEPVLATADGASITLHNQQPPLGVLDDACFHQDTLPAGPGDCLLMHSDGVSDAIDAQGERVGSARVRQTFLRLARSHVAPGAVLQLLRHDMLNGATLTDDTTLLVARICALDDYTRLDLACDTASLPALRRLVETQARAASVGEIDRGLFAVAVTEVFTNIVRHATGLLDGASIEVFAHRGKERLTIELVHVGDPFSPPSELPPTHFETLPEGGFGLAIIWKAADQVVYDHHAGVNTTRLSIGADRALKH
ncbi:PAS domain S-box protein [Variovorax sp. LT2P21]|uniref:PAS domain S-box protein n=1 Tax=Variovorax sp. LT2P21 TaxID=3443731 RepID=UPI003F47B2A1